MKRNRIKIFIVTLSLCVVVSILRHENFAYAQEKSTKETTLDKTALKFKLSAEIISKSEITVKSVKERTILIKLNAPGEVTLNMNKTANIVSQINGVVIEVKKSLGDKVKAGEVLAVIKSRELSDAQTNLFSAKLKEDLALEVFNREEKLQEKKITSAQEFLAAKNSLSEARIAYNAAKQFLLGLGLSETEVSALTNGTQKFLIQYEIKAPIDGAIIERKISNGELVTTSTELFFIADLATVWVDVAINANQISQAKVGQNAVISSKIIKKEVAGKLFYISPLIDKKTNSVMARFEIENNDSIWRPGLFVTTEVILSEIKATKAISNNAIQIIDKVPVVFVKNGNDFEVRRVKIGSNDGEFSELLEGLNLGESYVDENSFVLKAHILNMEAE